MLILGVDPGSRVTGYGVIESTGTTHEIIDYGVIRTHPRNPFSRRLLHVYNDLNRIINQYKPNVVALEDVFFAVNIRSLLTLGHIRGIVLVVAAQANIDIHEYSPLEVKKAVVGYGRADKRQVQKMVQLILNLAQMPEPNDAADALAVAICHIHNSNKNFNRTMLRLKARATADLSKQA